MPMQSMQKSTNKIKKSHALIIGSLLVFGGFVFLSWDYLLRIRDEVYSDMKIKMMMNNTNSEVSTPIQEEITESSEFASYVDNTIDYSMYYGVLDIPKIGLKRGFYNVDSKYNNISQNVTMVDGSVMPDAERGNLILMAHSGNAYISYFAYLYKLEVGDECYILYNGQSYHFRIVNIYDVEKNGIVSLDVNENVSTLTLITCTKDSDSLQTVYIFEEVG